MRSRTPLASVKKLQGPKVHGSPDAQLHSAPCAVRNDSGEAGEAVDSGEAEEAVDSGEAGEAVDSGEAEEAVDS